MENVLNDFLLMIQFFTRIPINKNLQCEKVNLEEELFSSCSSFYYRWNGVFNIFRP